MVESSVLSECLSTLRYCLKVTDCLGGEVPGRGRECLSSPSPDHALRAVPQVVKEGRKLLLLLLGAKGAGGTQRRKDGWRGRPEAETEAEPFTCPPVPTEPPIQATPRLCPQLLAISGRASGSVAMGGESLSTPVATEKKKSNVRGKETSPKNNNVRPKLQVALN